MTIFKTILHVLKKNLGTLSIGLVVSIGISFLYAESLDSSTEISLSTSTVAIFNEDQGAISKDLESYLADTVQVEELEKKQEAIDDALYFKQVDYVLTIPNGFSEAVQNGETPKMDVQVAPGTYSKALLDSTINHYLNTFTRYQQTIPDASTEELLSLTNDNLEVEGTVSLDEGYSENVYLDASAAVFSLLAYGLFSTVFSGTAYSYIAFNKPEIRKRNLCSPISSRRLSRNITLSTLGYSILMLLFFLAYTLIYTKSSLNEHTLLFVANACVFFLTIVTFSAMICSLLKNPIVITGINNTYILGTCFICGIFIPRDFLPEAVVKVSMVTPTYWFTNFNQLIAETTEFNDAFYQEMLLHFGVMIAFCLAFIVINWIRQRETGGLRKTAAKVSFTR